MNGDVINNPSTTYVQWDPPLPDTNGAPLVTFGDGWATLPTDPPGCEYCGDQHDGVCERVSAIEYHRDGSIKRVEFHP